MDKYYIFAETWHILVAGIRGAIISIAVGTLIMLIGEGNPLILFGLSFFLCLSWILMIDLLHYREPDIIQVIPPPKPADLHQAVILSRINESTHHRRYEQIEEYPNTDQREWEDWLSVASEDRLPGIISAIFETGRASSRSTRATKRELQNLHRFLLSRGYAEPYQKGIRLTDAGRAEIARMIQTHSPIDRVYANVGKLPRQTDSDADSQTKKAVYRMFR